VTLSVIFGSRIANVIILEDRTYRVILSFFVKEGLLTEPSTA